MPSKKEFGPATHEAPFLFSFFDVLRVVDQRLAVQGCDGIGGTGEHNDGN